MKILARNLARNMTQDELKQMFVTFGEVKSCDLVLDQVTGKSKGFGFLEMPVEAAASAAIKALDGKTVQGSKMRVKKVKGA